MSLKLMLLIKGAANTLLHSTFERSQVQKEPVIFHFTSPNKKGAFHKLLLKKELFISSFSLTYYFQTMTLALSRSASRVRSGASSQPDRSSTPYIFRYRAYYRIGGSSMVFFADHVRSAHASQARNQKNDIGNTHYK